MPKKIVTKSKIISNGDENKERFLPVTCEKNGCSKNENRNEINNAIAAVVTDSNKYCSTNCCLPAPTTFLMLTSFALPAERAVARFV